jgi:hypothetical protein
VLLDALDFRAEQSYHRGRLARALTYLFGTGTAAGLAVVWEKPIRPGTDTDFPDGREERLRLKPGLAIDRLGRLIEVPREWCIRLGRWYGSRTPAELSAALHQGVVTADVFLRFLTDERGRTPAFASGPFDATDATIPSRLRDAFAVDLVLRPEPTPPLPHGLPGNPSWPDLSQGTAGERRDALHTALLGAWREGTGFLDDQGRLGPLAEHVPGQDTTAVLLARVALPADPAEADGRPVRKDPFTVDVGVDNLLRRFAYPAGALAALQGIRLRGDMP